MIQILATIFGLTQGIFAWANKKINWVFYCLQYVFLGIFNLQASLYGDAFSSLVYIGVGVFGWIYWGKLKDKNINIQKASGKERFIYITIIIIATILLSIYLANFTDDVLPRLDAFTTVSGLVAIYYTLTKKIDTWVIWFINDVVFTIEYLMLPEPPVYLIVLNIIWAGMAVGSFINWYKLLKKETVPNVACTE